MIPRYRVCDHCEDECHIGTSEKPLVQIVIGVLENGLSYDAKLPRWAWRLWTRFRADTISAEDGLPGELEPVPVKHELCVGCVSKLLKAKGAHDVIVQREYRKEARVKAKQAQRKKAK